MKVIIIQGGLGNQMFQYALYLANKDDYNNLYCDISSYMINKNHNGFELDKVFNIEKDTLLNEFFPKNNIFEKFRFKIKNRLRKRKIIQDNFIFNKKLLEDETKKDIYYLGYWQSEKYFFNKREEILEKFKFKKFEANKNKELAKKIEMTQSVSIHIRRGDYLNNTILGNVVSKKYYEDAIEYIREKIDNPYFFIFSDDIKWCEDNFKFTNNEAKYIDWNKKEESYRDMQLISLCKHNIIANSSFSWWGAWLNPNKNKIVIAPEKWFSESSKLNYQDVVPESWVRIENGI